MRFSAIRRPAIIGLLVTALIALFAGTGAAAPAAPAAAPVSTPIAGTFTDALGGTGTATGTFTPTQFIAQGDQILSQGVADLTLVDSAGQPVGTASPTVTLPTAIAPGAGTQATCQILDLVLGPLDLNLLGLVVHLNQVHLNITAESGPGNLLGNLLCAIAGLLNPGPPADLQALVNLLNAILAILNA
ncbi:hypothetical protein [Actinocrispum sp. NPDC049592]|uniref:hypothetical protein n=1 Tax=Actinocrispum sp. NPDC049592 TaxID=3154835 RepID=UPI003425D532